MAHGIIFLVLMPLFLIFFIGIIPAGSNPIRDNCESAANCLDCLDAGGSCKWCADIGYDPQQPRCATLKKLEKNGCTNIQIEDGKVYKPPTDYGVKTQVQPKRISLKLRPGESQSFTVSVTPSDNFPVRLYYLMDMSNTMEDDLDNLRKLGTKIANGVKNLTNNFQLAFGTFVDKTVAPFTGYQWGVGAPRAPCWGCEPTFGYKHVFDFNEDARLFEDAVARQRVSGNLDTPEGGFDALMQVTVCGDKIWPQDEHFRRIVVFVTDATPHIAGDGKVGGITTPNDGKCYLTRDMRYSKSTQMDYPSISQLKEKMKEHGVVPILAVTSEVEDVYRKLVEEWKDLGTGMGSLEPDSSNIVHLIRENYKKIATTIRLTDNSPGNIVVKYKVIGGCRDSHDDNECTGVGINEKIDFRVSITAANCPSSWRGGDRFNITVPGFGDITVDARYICKCDCYADGLPLSPICNGHGTLKCGICHCHPQRFGKFCECDDKAQADTTLCQMPNSTEKSICSGFGTCICGKCECNTEADDHRQISGTYCQCNNFGCDRFDGQLCGGLERGICKCGRCVCKEAFQGENCGQKNCTLGKKHCERHGVVCSGNGKCNCDQCECDYGYSGKLCETCVFCERKCKNNVRCVMCHEPYSIGDANFCAACRRRLHVVVVNNTDLEKYGQRKCSSYYNETCRVYFSYSSDPMGNETIHLEGTPRCIRILSSDAPIYLIILCIIGGIVLIVLLLLLVCKVIVTAYDRYEYGRFERDRMGSKWGKTENPIYRPAKRQFENPVYAGGVAGTCQVGPCHVVVKTGSNVIAQHHTLS